MVVSLVTYHYIVCFPSPLSFHQTKSIKVFWIENAFTYICSTGCLLPVFTIHSIFWHSYEMFPYYSTFNDFKQDMHKAVKQQSLTHGTLRVLFIISTGHRAQSIESHLQTTDFLAKLIPFCFYCELHFAFHIGTPYTFTTQSLEDLTSAVFVNMWMFKYT